MLVTLLSFEFRDVEALNIGQARWSSIEAVGRGDSLNSHYSAPQSRASYIRCCPHSVITGSSE